MKWTALGGMPWVLTYPGRVDGASDDGMSEGGQTNLYFRGDAPENIGSWGMAKPAHGLGGAIINDVGAVQFRERDAPGSLPQLQIDDKQPNGDSIRRITLGDFWALIVTGSVAEAGTPKIGAG